VTGIILSRSGAEDFCVMERPFSLLDKYNVPVPRYTSYPTVPLWKETGELLPLGELISRSDDEKLSGQGISIYVHLPFCESLCTYCGCNKRITKNHSVEEKYIHYLLKEWKLYLEKLPAGTRIREIHLGGGTPTFFSPANLHRLLEEMESSLPLHEDFEAGFEGHPNNTTPEHLQVLHELGFRRVSFGVQDLDLQVQQAINRIQPHAKVVEVVKAAREIGYGSVNFDLIYGLPFQSQASVRNTFEQVIRLQPDRIAFYSYAHVPWVSKSQRAYSEADLPKGEAKRALYNLGRSLLIQAGYKDIGMDHFALETDSLFVAQQQKRLHRNFMGYTTSHTDILVGLGVSAISDFYRGYRQNCKTVEAYYDTLDQDLLPVVKGIDLSPADVLARKHILEMTCNFETEVDTIHGPEIEETYRNMLVEDGLIRVQGNTVRATEAGKALIRNVAAMFDPSYHYAAAGTVNTFSQAV